MLLRNKRGGWFEVPDDEYMKYKSIAANKKQADIRNNMTPINTLESGKRKIIFANSGEDDDYDDDDDDYTSSSYTKHLSLEEYEKVGKLKKKLAEAQRELNDVIYKINTYNKNDSATKSYEQDKKHWENEIARIQKEIDKIEKG